MRVVIVLLAAAQAVLGVRVLARFLRTAGGSVVRRAGDRPEDAGAISVLLPVLDEVDRLAPCLEGLQTQTNVVAEILVIDGGSTDGTQALVASAARDDRVRLLDASPVPDGVNGKAHGLQAGLDAALTQTPWILTIDADVRLDPALASSLLQHARQHGVQALSAATRQQVSGLLLGALHPAMLATLVYRFGIPGSETGRVTQVQANGQCFLVSRAALNRVGGFTRVRNSACEDVSLARELAASGYRVGFYETGGLASVEMYPGWRAAWDNWTRSLPLRDHHSGRSGWTGLAEILLVQALPLWLTPMFAFWKGSRHLATRLNAGLALVRFAVLAGTARAYHSPPWTYWLSPLADLPVTVRIVQMAQRRNHIWRGRTFTTGGVA